MRAPLDSGNQAALTSLTSNPNFLHKMPSCCVIGCKSRNLKNRNAAFYIIPYETERRNLWLQAIQRANGGDKLKKNVLICGDHFVSGKVSVDHNSQDYVPSVFPHSSPQKVKRKHDSESHTSHMETDIVTPLLEKGELSEVKQGPPTPSLPKEIKTDSKEDEVEDGVINIKSEAASNLQRTSLSHEAVVIPKLGTRRPVILLKNVFNQAGAYQCDRCNRTFTDISQFVKHSQQHDEEQPLSNDVDMSVPLEFPEKSTKSEGSNDHILKDELAFKCNMCERAFSTGHNLKRHKLLHVKDDRKCRQCGVLFCRRHISFWPRPVVKHDVEEDVSADETEPVNTNLTPENSQKDVDPNPKMEFADTSHTTITVVNQIVSPSSTKPEHVATTSKSKTTTTCPLMSPVIPDPKMLNPSRPPSPILIRFNRKSSYHFKPMRIKHEKNFVQPHLPVLPYLPPSLQMFSPQCLTSSFLEVKRNYACILGQRLNVNAVKEEPCVSPVFTPTQPQ